MNFFWKNCYDRFKDRRYAAFFLMVLLLFVVSIFPAAALCELWREHHFAYLLPTLGALISAAGWWGFRWVRSNRRQRSEFPPLSSDELRAARSKLLKARERKGI